MFHEKQFELVNQAKKKKKTDYTHSGMLEIVSIQVVAKQTPPQVVKLMQTIQPKDDVQFTLKAVNLDSMDMIGKSDPFLIIYRLRDHEKPLKIFQSEVIDGNLNPEWKLFSISVSDLTGGDMKNAKVLIECWDKDPASQEFIGSTSVSQSLMSLRHRFHLQSFFTSKSMN